MQEAQRGILKCALMLLSSYNLVKIWYIFISLSISFSLSLSRKKNRLKELYVNIPVSVYVCMCMCEDFMDSVFSLNILL